MPLCARLTIAALVLVISACSKASRPSSNPKEVPATTVQAVASTPRGPLVVAVVFDQLGADTLERLLPILDQQGALRMGISQGAFYPQVAYPHAVTLTAPGHALLFTGATPAQTAITGNTLARAGGVLSSSVDDGKHSVYGLRGVHASPTLLQAPTVGDALHAKHGERGAQVISISLKDRAAILPGGQKANLAFWYEAAIPGFTTSTYYAPEIPKFAVDYQVEHPLSKLSAVWEFVPSATATPILGPDDALGESDYAGFGTVFPHNPKATPSIPAVLRLTPALSEYLIDFTEHVANTLKLGQDDVPDLLLLSISGTDYAGHAFGPHSWEYFDHLRRADLALGKMLRRLEKKTKLSVLISSDHGVAALPEHKAQGGRLASQELTSQVESALDAVLGPGDWVLGFSAPYLYLRPEAQKHPESARVRKLACEALSAVKGVHAAFDTHSLQDGAGSFSPCKPPVGTEPMGLSQSVAESIHPAHSGDFYVVPISRTILDESSSGTGTTHGSPWPYDRNVFVVAFGQGVDHGKHPELLDTRSVAPSLSALLGIAPPSKATAKPLPGIAQ